jgi:hypothetical protein
LYIKYSNAGDGERKTPLTTPETSDRLWEDFPDEAVHLYIL